MARPRFLPSLLFAALAGCAQGADLGDETYDYTTRPRGRFDDGSAPMSLRLRAVGDVMMGTDFPGSGVHLPPSDGATLLAGVVDALRDADVTVANLEGPLCDGGSTNKCGANTANCYAFRTPTHYADYLVEAGVDMVSLANNHAMDFGDFCRRQTEQTMDDRGIVWSGRPGSVATFVREDGVRIALLGFHSAAHSNSTLDIPRASSFVREVRETHDLVVVFFHGGGEGSNATRLVDGPEYYLGENRGDLKRFSRAVIDAGADLVLGSGPHVPRAMELYKGHLIAYSLGNFATYGRFNLSGNKGVSLILDAEIDVVTGQFVSGQILPVKLVNRGFPVTDDACQSVDLITELTALDVAGGNLTIDSDGFVLPESSAPFEPTTTTP